MTDTDEIIQFQIEKAVAEFLANKEHMSTGEFTDSFKVTINGTEAKTFEIDECCIKQPPKAKLVRVNPCSDNPENKTYLGFYLGRAPIDTSLFFDKKENRLSVVHHNNPVIFIPELGKCVYGINSWWGEIKSPEELSAITKDEINNTWYVKMLKDLLEDENVENDDK
jgi:hypothetical protein